MKVLFTLAKTGTGMVDGAVSRQIWFDFIHVRKIVTCSGPTEVRKFYHADAKLLSLVRNFKKKQMLFFEILYKHDLQVNYVSQT